MRLETWLKDGPLLTDGAWGTELQRRGLGAGECPDPWNLENPGPVGEVARAYVEAGSRVILTNTFSSNRVALGRHGMAERAAAINRAGVEISRRAAAGKARVAASRGPTGAVLAAGEVGEDAVRAAFAEQARALAEAGADALLVETQSDPLEARLAVQAARETGLPVIASFTFSMGKDKDRTLTGAAPEQAAREAAEAGADAVGANCGLGVEALIPICRRLCAAVKLPVWIKPNAGLPRVVEGRTVYDGTPEDFARGVAELVRAGASFVGGCCGTTPAHIREAARRSVK